MRFYGHSQMRNDRSYWQPLAEHLEAVERVILGMAR